ncbi:hypothetical protein [Neorhizobium galegae]|uniref:hypothetical protein n=1 Tax=Neorhizobium galegae TaxID=399 RepID=UPI0006219994|nr:hypothetical protein [Neorhizobium galegae]KAB1122097.1 hypothetical protein F4V90_23220 [Neorhizobium galegae]MCQ1810546.1 hypothetical protein [Neorhizobium galegae]CDZ62063.1 Hypothetical protein NGAL_HAMBI2566_48560 [Neorhizobium galegae bv. orientalis]
MPALIRFMLHHLVIGFAIGAAAAIVLLAIQPQRLVNASELRLVVCLYVLGLGASFALGSLATALMMDTEG